MGLDIGNAEPRGDLALREAGPVVQPGGAHAKVRFLVICAAGDGHVQALLPEIFFCW